MAAAGHSNDCSVAKDLKSLAPMTSENEGAW